MRERQPVPANLVNAQGEVSFGVFDGPCRNINLTDAALRWHGMPLPRAAVRFRLKEWQHFGLVLPELFVGCAIVNAGLLRTSWCFVVDRRTGEKFEHKQLGLALDLRIARELWHDTTYVHGRGYRIDVQNSLDQGEHRLGLHIEASKAGPEVQGDLRCLHDLSKVEPLVVVLPVGPNRGMYSHKVALPLEGSLRIGDRTVQADGETSFAILDIHKAHYPHHTWWNWATCAGRLADGRAVAMNLTRNVNRDDARYNENGVWVDGKLHLLGPAIFEFNRLDIMTPWRLSTADNAMNLVFEPQGERAENVNAGVIRSVFRQPYGTFSGTAKVGGETVTFDRLFGVCEDHDALW